MNQLLSLQSISCKTTFLLKLSTCMIGVGTWTWDPGPRMVSCWLHESSILTDSAFTRSEPFTFGCVFFRVGTSFGLFFFAGKPKNTSVLADAYPFLKICFLKGGHREHLPLGGFPPPKTQRQAGAPRRTGPGASGSCRTCCG